MAGDIRLGDAVLPFGHKAGEGVGQLGAAAVIEGDVERMRAVKRRALEAVNLFLQLFVNLLRRHNEQIQS